VFENVVFDQVEGLALLHELEVVFTSHVLFDLGFEEGGDGMFVKVVVLLARDVELVFKQIPAELVPVAVGILFLDHGWPHGAVALLPVVAVDQLLLKSLGDLFGQRN